MPYSYQRFGIDCEVQNYELDSETRDGPIERQRQLVDATRQTEWSTIRLNLELQIPSDVIQTVFAETERDDHRQHSLSSLVAKIRIFARAKRSQPIPSSAVILLVPLFRGAVFGTG
jgi:hypothetical protein